MGPTLVGTQWELIGNVKDPESSVVASGGKQGFGRNPPTSSSAPP